jgi:hypothetical protein
MKSTDMAVFVRPEALEGQKLKQPVYGSTGSPLTGTNAGFDLI